MHPTNELTLALSRGRRRMRALATVAARLHATTTTVAARQLQRACVRLQLLQLAESLAFFFGASY